MIAPLTPAPDARHDPDADAFAPALPRGSAGGANAPRGATVIPIPAAGHAPPPATTPAPAAGKLDGAALTALAAQIDGRMQSAGRVLADVLQALDLIGGQLQAVCDAVADSDAVAALDDLGRFADALSELPGRRCRRLQVLAGARDTQRRLVRSVAEIRQILQVLGIYGLTVTIAAASSDHSDDLIRSMSERLVQGGGHVRVFGQRLDSVRKALDSLVELDETVGQECVRVVPAVPDRLREAGRALASHQGALVALGQQMQRLVGPVRNRVADALGALQIGDSTRQRIEHVAAGAGLLDAAMAGMDAVEAEAAAAAGRHLLAAQLHASADALDRGTQALTAIFDALAPDAAALGRLREDGAAGAAGVTLLQHLQSSVSDSEALTQRLRAADGQTGAVTQLIGETVAALRASLADIAEIRSDVHHMAINIGLRYRGEDGVGAAARVVASEINLYSRRLDDEGKRIAAAIATLADLASALDDSALQDGAGDGRSLGTVVAVIGRGTRAGQGEVSGARRAVDGALASLAEARAMLTAQAGFAAELRRMAGPPAAAPPAPRTARYDTLFLTPLQASYTMADERRLHASLVGGTTAAATAPVAPAVGSEVGGDDLADFTLF